MGKISFPSLFSTSSYLFHSVGSFMFQTSYLPLHWALSKDRPNLEIIYLLVGAYPEGLFDPDYEDHLPYDK